MAFYYRHQAGGTLFDVPFPSMPTDDQIGALRALMIGRHGERHPKTGEQYWDRIEESTGVLDAAGVPIMRVVHGYTPAQSGNPNELSGDELAEAKASRIQYEFKGTGQGRVDNPE